MIPVPKLPDALEAGLRAQRDDWDDSKLHVSDLSVAIGEKCPRQLWLRINGAEKKEMTAGQLMMFDNAKGIHDRVIPILQEGLSGGWRIESVERAVFLGPVTGRYDTRLWHDGEGWEIIVDFKTMRGRAFQYLDGVKPSHKLQVQAYITAADADGGLVFYLDREGQNRPRQFYLQRDDAEVDRAVIEACQICKQVEPPPILPPQIEIRENKGPDSVYLKQPWQCDYCDYAGPSCLGALPVNLRNLGIVAKIKDGEVMPQKGIPEQAVESVKSLLIQEAIS